LLILDKLKLECFVSFDVFIKIVNFQVAQSLPTLSCPFSSFFLYSISRSFLAGSITYRACCKAGFISTVISFTPSSGGPNLNTASAPFKKRVFSNVD